MKPDYLLKTRRQAIARARRKHGLKDYEGALAEWNELLDRNANDSLAMLGRFDCLLKIGDKDTIMEIGDQVCEVNPDSQAAQNNFACLLLERGEYQRAISYFNKVIALDDSRVMYFFNAGLAYRGANQLNEAAVCFERVLTFEPEHQRAIEFLSQIYQAYGLRDSVIDLSMRLRMLRPGYTLPLQRRMYCLHTNASIDDSERVTDTLILRNALPPRSGGSKESGALRIGWMVCPFSLPLLKYMLPLLAAHAEVRSVVLVGYVNEVLLNEENVDDLFDEVHSTQSSAPDSMHQLIDNNPVDVLIDSVGQMPNNFMSIYTKRLASLQLSWPVSQSLVDLVLMDYSLVDEVVFPSKSTKANQMNRQQTYNDVGQTTSLDIEDKIFRLDAGLFAYDPPQSNVQLSPLPALKNGFVSFGVHTDLMNINAECVRIWSELLGQTRDARLVIFNQYFPSPIAETALSSLFAANNVDLKRIVFKNDPADFSLRFEKYSEIDIVLNSSPVGESLSLADALWMGCPTLHLESPAHISRLSKSVLESANCSKWSFGSEQEFINEAVDLCKDVDVLADLRSNLRSEVSNSPICNVKSWVKEFTEKIETLLNTNN